MCVRTQRFWQTSGRVLKVSNWRRSTWALILFNLVLLTVIAAAVGTGTLAQDTCSGSGNPTPHPCQFTRHDLAASLGGFWILLYLTMWTCFDFLLVAIWLSTGHRERADLSAPR